jgi:hypothetical protein
LGGKKCYQVSWNKKRSLAAIFFYNPIFLYD